MVRDGDIITGGGVTAGIDFGLTVAAELAGEATRPGACSWPSNTRRRRRSTPAARRRRRQRCVAAVEAQMSKLMPQRLAEAKAAAARLA